MGQQSNIIKLVRILLLGLSIWDFASMGFVSNIMHVMSIQLRSKSLLRPNLTPIQLFELGVGMRPTSTYIDIQCIRVGMACGPSSIYIVILY